LRFSDIRFECSVICHLTSDFRIPHPASGIPHFPNVFMKKLKKLCLNLLLLGISSFVALLLCEAACRLILNPADFLSVEIVSDKILGGIPAAKGRFDAWGFRNSKVPPTTEIVAVGDSHTFGNTAKMEEAWPHVLGKLTGKTVYNMGMGGYGPNQYFHLFKTKALQLKPRQIVCGLYMGDDFENAYLITYGLDHWAHLRQLSPQSKADFNIWRSAESTSWHKKIRVWLSRHSVLYMLVVHGPVLGRLKGDVQIRNAEKMYDSATSLVIPEKNIEEAFLPKGILMRLNQDDERIREGMRITFLLLKEMNEICRRENIEFIVAVIPTKEMVFAEYLEHNQKIAMTDVIDKLLVNERKAREATFNTLRESQIRAVDTLPFLKKSIERGLYAHTAADMHPGKNGYHVIAEAIASELEAEKPSN
jgi:hypothetical protein